MIARQSASVRHARFTMGDRASGYRIKCSKLSNFDHDSETDNGRLARSLASRWIEIRHRWLPCRLLVVHWRLTIRSTARPNSRKILRYARSFPPGAERNRHRQVALSPRALFKNKKWLGAPTVDRRDFIRGISFAYISQRKMAAEP
jgi:hypothetical protein